MKICMFYNSKTYKIHNSLCVLHSVCFTLDVLQHLRIEKGISLGVCYHRKLFVARSIELREIIILDCPRSFFRFIRK